MMETLNWTAVCALADILPDTGVCARVAGEHIAVFHLPAREETVFAIGNVDPNSQASVLSRGLVGNLGDRVVVASPIYKHHFDLRTGECLEAPQNGVKTYPARVAGGKVWVAA